MIARFFSILNRSGEACGSCRWRAHAWVLMGKGPEWLEMERVPQSFELASLLASKTTVSRERLGQRLGMGHPGSVSRMLGEEKKSGTGEKIE